MIYVNVDLETTGLHCDRGAILSIGAIAHDSVDWSEIGQFSRNLRIPPGRIWEPSYKEFWDSQPKEILEANTENPSDPWWVLSSMLDWMDHLSRIAKGLDSRVAFVANPIAFDMPMLRSYMIEYVPERWATFAEANKAGFGGVDLPTLAMTVMGADVRDIIVPYPDARRRMWPERWTPKELPLTHIAIDDARLQAHAFVCMMRELEEIRGRRPY